MELHEIEAFLPLVQRAKEAKGHIYDWQGNPNLHWLREDLRQFARGIAQAEAESA